MQTIQSVFQQYYIASAWVYHITSKDSYTVQGEIKGNCEAAD